MSETDERARKLLDDLQERAKELNCLYRVDEVLSRQDSPSQEVYRELIQAIPPGWQYPEVCGGVVSVPGEFGASSSYVEHPWQLSADIVVHGETIGEIVVYYTEERPRSDEGPFLREERRLITAIAERVGFHVMQRRLRKEHANWESAVQRLSSPARNPWKVLLDFFRRTDPNLLQRIARKMINHLCWNGIEGAESLLQESLLEFGPVQAGEPEANWPMVRGARQDTMGLTDRTFELASRHLSDAELVSRIQCWINEEKSTFLIKSLENPGTGLADLVEAIERYQSAAIDESELTVAVRTSLKVSLLRRFFVDQLDFINVAKQFVEIGDFFDLVKHMIFTSRSQGKLGGKAAGLFLATRALRKSTEYAEVFHDMKVPKTWYVASDAILEFIQHNNLNEVYNRKYMEIERVRQDYPYIIQVFKNSDFPREIVKGLAAALDDFEDRPLIVRSSSLLEDRVGSAFSGKYKSLFLANQGTKQQRLEALQDAIAEVYASVFGPDPIEYRAERGLLDFREEMGILIQEVVGQRIGSCFLPAFAGVAFSNNEFRWSPRIKREDGLVRMVPGLGTRAVDRMSDDYPVLVAPGQPGLRVNWSADEIIRYSPRKMDLINLERNTFETVEIEGLLRTCGEELPVARRMVSLVDGDRVRKPMGLEPDWESDDFVVTFEGLFTDTPFISRMGALLRVLREKLGMPVDIEFASTGEDLYLVQCRSQSRSAEHAPASIPRDLPKDKVIFQANRYISNGRISNITHIVYVVPENYAKLGDVREMKDVARAVGWLNALLPRRQFVLIGPGRWGSRGDIRLGVSVTYSDINNTALLMEVARQTGEYQPELSFGTHFFQDLVEADIRYIPIYPDRPGMHCNERFLLRSRNILPDILPDFAHLADTLRVIDVPKQTEGRVLRVLLNADLDEAVGILAQPSADSDSPGRVEEAQEEVSGYHWRWRLTMARRIAASLDAARFGVKAFYVFGSTKNATAAANSDLDVIVHHTGSAEQRRELELWLEGWSLSMAESNHLRTGYRSEGLLDVHVVTDEDVERQTSFAAKIGAITDAARRLPLQGEPGAGSAVEDE